MTSTLFHRWESTEPKNTLKIEGKLLYSQTAIGFVRFHPSSSFKGWAWAWIASESNLSLKWHMVALTGSVIWLSVTGLFRKLSCDFPCFLAIWNLTVNLLIYFLYTTFIWSLWTVDFISFRLASLKINKLTVVFSRAFPPAAILLFSESWTYHETIQPFHLGDCSKAISSVPTFSTY